MATKSTPNRNQRQEKPRRGEKSPKKDPARAQKPPAEVVQPRSLSELSSEEIAKLDVDAMKSYRLAGEVVDQILSEIETLKGRKKIAVQRLTEAGIRLRYHSLEREKVQLNLFPPDKDALKAPKFDAPKGGVTVSSARV